MIDDHCQIQFHKPQRQKFYQMQIHKDKHCQGKKKKTPHNFGKTNPYEMQIF
jgi:hypothetical protein